MSQLRSEETTWKVGMVALATGDDLPIRKYIKSIKDNENQFSHNGRMELQIIGKGKTRMDL